MAKPKFATVDDMKAALETMPAGHVDCRDLGHQWKPFTAVYDDVSNSYDVVHRCPRCKTRRRRLLTSTGHVVGSSYNYNEADHYLVHGLGRIAGEAKDAVRLMGTTLFMASRPANPARKAAQRTRRRRQVG